jgi:hypothetical protein
MKKKNKIIKKKKKNEIGRIKEIYSKEELSQLKELVLSSKKKTERCIKRT